MLMILHYLKVALRSLIKYKIQTIVCLVGLSVGFVCFAYSMIWIRYELTYDDFHRGADRLYVLYQKSGYDASIVATTDAYPLAETMRKSFPEIEDATAFLRRRFEVKWKEQTSWLNRLEVDSSFVRMFDVRLIQGSWEFLHSPTKIALTEEAARRIFGTTDVLGREIVAKGSKMTVTAIVSGWSRHSNFFYEVLAGISESDKNNWLSVGFTTCIRLGNASDMHTFAQKLEKHTFSQSAERRPEKLLLEPLVRCHYTIYQDVHHVSLKYVLWFSIIGGLIVLLALVNYFSMLVTRIRIRARELALRTICGSSRTGLLLLLVAELVLLLLASGLLGMVLIELSASSFCELSHVEGKVMFQAFFYYLIVFVFALLLTFGVISYYSRKSLAAVLTGSLNAGSTRTNFQRVSVGLQLAMSVLVLFCVSVLMKQLYYLSNTEDIGFERDGRAVLFCTEGKEIMHDLRQLPYVMEVHEDLYSLLPCVYPNVCAMNEWEGKRMDDSPILLQCCTTRSEEFMHFYGIRLLQGDGQLDTPNEVLLSESAVKLFGWFDPIGKKLGNYTVTGVIKDIHCYEPTSHSFPPVAIFESSDPSTGFIKSNLIRFDERYTNELKRFCEEKAKEYGLEYYSLEIINEVYNKFLVSEYALMYLLSFISVVCMVISVFGIYSNVTLDCARRQKEIAIRKVSGATAGNIIRSFVYQYGLLLFIACLVAFPVGYVLMKRWLESYVEQTSLSWWLYAVIFFGMALLVALCIGWRVWRAANENPAEVVKRE